MTRAIPTTRAWRPTSQLHPRLQLSGILAGVVIALIPLGPVLQASLPQGHLGIAACQFAVALLAIHLVLSHFYSATQGLRTPRLHARLMFLLCACLAVPILYAPSFASAAIAYFNFATGLVGGILVGSIWAFLPPSKWTAVDIGISIFLLAGSAQLLVAFAGAGGGLSTLHQNSETPWGDSNYVAGSLSVAAIVLIGRLREVERTRRIYYVPAIIAIVAALLTLSRGAVVALGIGLVVFTWNAAKTRATRALLRLLALAIPVLAYVAIDIATSQRLQVNTRVLANVSDRFELYRLAWSDFVASPLVGSGWVSFRDVTDTQAAAESFAHNLVLSFLQIGGIAFGLPFLVVLAVWIVRACRSNVYLAGAVLAAVAIALTDPFFEGTIGSLLAWSILIKAASQVPVRSSQTELDGTRSRGRSTARRLGP